MRELRIFGTALLMAGLLLPVACGPSLIPPGAEFLGRREVNFGIDRDTIVVSRSAGPLHQLIVVARSNPVEVYDIRVVFGNGSSENFNMRQRLFVDRDRLILDLPGNVRIVREVIFHYRTLNFAADRAVVELWGR